MQIWLSETGPSMWFLGKPNNIRVSLNFTNKGPVEINFDQLDPDDQEKMLIDLKAGKIESNVEFFELYQKWIDNKPNIAEPSSEVKQHIEKVEKDKRVKKQAKLYKQQKTREEKLIKRCEYLSKKGVRAIKAGTKDETDIRVFLTLKELEEKRKKVRASIKDYINLKIRQLQREVVININNSSKQPPLQMSKKMTLQETIPLDVIESEEKIVEFSTEELQKFINKS